MAFEGEFASYEPLRRLLDSEKVKALQNRYRIREKSDGDSSTISNLVSKIDIPQSEIKPDLVLAIDGSNIVAKAENGFPGAEFGYITVASVLIDLKKINELEKNDFVDPQEFRKTEKASTIDSVFPGCNIILDNEQNAKSSLRRALFEELSSNKIFEDCESLLETYEYLFKLKRENFPNSSLPKSPIEQYSNEEMTYGYGEYTCPHSNQALFSSDALRLHELMNPGGTNGEMFGQIMSTLEKLWFIHVLRAFEQKGWLATLRRVAFVLDGPLAVFSTSSWLTKVIEIELGRINELQKEVNQTDLLIFGVEKSGTFYNHFEDLDITTEGIKDKFPRQSAKLLDDGYIKRNIIFSESPKPYGQDTYFGRKFFYKAESGQRIVVVSATFNQSQKDLSTANTNQFSRLADIMNIIDRLASSRHPNSISPLISAHAEASIPLNLGKRIFEDIARELRQSDV